MYNNLVERCFTTCVDSFRRKTLEKSEETARARRSSCPLSPLLTRPPGRTVRDTVL
jgi:Tim10/DDP family zinc finger